MAVNKLDISMMEDVGTSANQLVQRDGSGNLPAIDGSQLTNVDTGFTQSTSDPVITTNPSGGVGSVWFNKTSGEAYICTDATAGANVWTNVGAGSGDVKPSPAPRQGTQYGYLFGGMPSVGGRINVIQKYSYTSAANATDVGNLLNVETHGTDNVCSTSHGYSMGHQNDSTNSNIIEKLSLIHI